MKITDEIIIAECIRDLRDKRGMTQEQLAELAGISVSHLSKVESGNRQIGMRTFIKILKTLDASDETLYELISGKDTENSIIYRFYQLIKDCSDKEIDMFLKTIGMMKENLRHYQYVGEMK